MSNPRTVSNVIEPTLVIEGAGVLLRRSIAPKRDNLFDPFLLFDHFAFNDPIEGPLVGFPMHPHRGIETVTYMLEGSVHHRDSLGNSGLIGSGDVQWMTSGSGIMHEEMPQPGQDEMIGFQLWVNLPARLKMSQPRYQEIFADQIPHVSRADGVKILVIAGEVDDVIGPVTEIEAEPIYLDITVPQGGEFKHPVGKGHTAFAYVFEGQGLFGNDGAGKPIKQPCLVEFGDGDYVAARATDEHVRFLLVSGKPLNEPIARYGPFVMNTQEEIQQALEDLRNGTFIFRETE